MLLIVIVVISAMRPHFIPAPPQDFQVWLVAGCSYSTEEAIEELLEARGRRSLWSRVFFYYCFSRKRRWRRAFVG